MKKNFIVQNLKCGGCANTIIKALNKFDQIKSVEVDATNSTVVVESETAINSSIIEEKLAALGYPLIDSKNSSFKKVNSYISCMTGKLSK